ncbi:MAG: tetratricopeptide repeat protein [Treponema sp.]|jgi:tetratricopeptide (TPR) repeat protein|nr:tetratricopeptide repeat protein [Treponema sp.]
MNIKKDTVIGLLVIMVIAALIIGFMLYRKYSARSELAARIAELSPRGGGPPITIDGLREAIALYEAQIEQHVKNAAQTAVYWKILATRLQDRGLHTEALNALAKAIEYTPQEPLLHYLRGLSAAVIAKNTYDTIVAKGDMLQREYYFSLAEHAYLQAIELDESYGKPRYGLGVLYVFELDRPEEAIPHLERYLEISKNNVDAMFVLARAYYTAGQDHQAVELYEHIPNLTKDPQKRLDAEQNKRTILSNRVIP